MNVDIPEPWQSRLKRLSRIAVGAWIVSLVISGTLDLLYRGNSAAAWINTVVVRLFQGLALLAMGVFVLGNLYAPPAGFRLGRAWRILGVVFGVITVLLGLWGLWGAGANALALLR